MTMYILKGNMTRAQAKLEFSLVSITIFFTFTLTFVIQLRKVAENDTWKHIPKHMKEA